MLLLSLAGAAGVWRLWIAPLAAAAALDLEAQLWNLSHDWAPGFPPPWFADRALIGPFTALVRLGTAPLACLALATWVARAVTPRGWAALRDRLPGVVRAALATLLLLPWLAAAFPLALVGATWLQVEIYAWVQWYENVEPAMEWALTHAPPPLTAALAVVGVGLACSLARAGASRSRRARVAGWVLGGPPLAAAAVVLAAAAVPLGIHAGRLTELRGDDSGRALYEQRCGDCHARGLTLYYVKTPAEWERTIRTQVEVEGAALDAGEQARLTAFVVGMRGFDDAWVLRTRCGRCHGGGWPGAPEVDAPAQFTPRTRADWEAITARIAAWSPYYHRADVRAQLVDELTRVAGDEGATQGLPATEYTQAVELGGRCGSCHGVSYRADAAARWSRDELEALVRRMDAKRPATATPAEQRALIDTYRTLLADPDRMDTLYPHERPIAEEPLPW